MTPQVQEVGRVGRDLGRIWRDELENQVGQLVAPIGVSLARPTSIQGENGMLVVSWSPSDHNPLSGASAAFGAARRPVESRRSTDPTLIGPRFGTAGLGDMATSREIGGNRPRSFTHSAPRALCIE